MTGLRFELRDAGGLPVDRVVSASEAEAARYADALAVMLGRRLSVHPICQGIEYTRPASCLPLTTEVLR